MGGGLGLEGRRGGTPLADDVPAAEGAVAGRADEARRVGRGVQLLREEGVRPDDAQRRVHDHEADVAVADDRGQLLALALQDVDLRVEHANEALRLVEAASKIFDRIRSPLDRTWVHAWSSGASYARAGDARAARTPSASQAATHSTSRTACASKAWHSWLSDVDLGEDPVAQPDEDHELRFRRGGTGEIVRHLGDVGDVDVALLRDGRPADALADADEHVVRRRADERAESEDVVGEQSRRYRSNGTSGGTREAWTARSRTASNGAARVADGFEVLADTLADHGWPPRRSDENRHV